MLATLSFCIIAYRHDQDVVSCLSFILIARSLALLLFLVSSNLLIWKIVGYALAAFCIVRFNRDPLAKFIIPIWVAAVASEIYWYLTDYQGPEIYWSFILISFNLATRYLLIVRFVLVPQYFNKPATPIRLDWYLKVLHLLPIVVECVYVFEYLVRHLTNTTPLYIYHAYPYIMHSIGMSTIFAVFYFSYTAKQEKTLLV
ncbi:hypothetical protein [Paraglaciecola sp.]|uniref:hypothetical protein n=1 Tax=Paraglaciecola sp. TaxID=1920173 RepID=UPI0030F47095